MEKPRRDAEARCSRDPDSAVWGGWAEREPDRRVACGGTGGAGAVRRRPQLCSPGLRRGPEAWPWATRSSGGAGGCPLQHTLTAQTTSVQQTGDSALSGFSRFLDKLPPWEEATWRRPPVCVGRGLWGRHALPAQGILAGSLAKLRAQGQTRDPPPQGRSPRWGQVRRRTVWAPIGCPKTGKSQGVGQGRGPAFSREPPEKPTALDSTHERRR